MKKTVSFFFMVQITLFSSMGISTGAETLKPDQLARQIEWFGNAGIKIKTHGQTLYIDPVELGDSPDPADIILITHSHGDHFSTMAISSIINKNTAILGPEDCISTIKDSEFIEESLKTGLQIIKPDQSKTIKGLLVEAVPAYNINSSNHQKNKNWLGYIVTIGGVRIYHAGDTERIPEMQMFSCDIALLPLGQTYTMESVEDAANSALDVKAKIAIPIHWGMWEGKLADAEKFKDLLKGKIDVMLITKK